MARSKAPIIRGPIGQGTPFKQVYNSDGTPNYVMAVQKQAELSKSNASKLNNSYIAEKGKNHDSDYMKNLKQSVSKVVREEVAAHKGREHHSQDKAASVINTPNQKAPTLTKDEPEIER